jgi:exodeoxyribonuclease VII large subunit
MQSISCEKADNFLHLFLERKYPFLYLSILKKLPEAIHDKKIYSLLEVTKSIQKTLSERYTSSFWVKAEMNKLNYYKQSGHCYPELVEKLDGKVIAQIKSYLWKEDYLHANENFLKILKEPLKDGIKILFQAKITFDPSHGIALWITDIDPSFTLGDLEREKQETISKLKNEGIFEKNKERYLPLLPQRIAIISVESSKGYADFIKVIESNSWNYKLFHLLFPSLLQGDKAVKGIVAQLKRIKKVKQHFDLVAIIRGGGGDVGLSCYNSYTLAKEIANFPLPVVTGIGHATNETVAELISHANAITPTKLAEYLLQKFHNFSVPVQNAERKIGDFSKRLLAESKAKFESEVKLFRLVTESHLNANRNEIRNFSVLLSKSMKQIFSIQNENVKNLKLNCFKHSINAIANEKVSLKHLEKNISLLHPENVLKRGYSITRLNGKSLINSKETKDGDILTTTLFKGTISSIVNQKKTKKNE